VPFNFLARSISRPSGIEGVRAHVHVEGGQEGIVGNEGLGWVEVYRLKEEVRERRHGDGERVMGRRNMRRCVFAEEKY